MAARKPLVNVSGVVSELPSGDTVEGALTNPMTTAGDMIVGGADGVPARLVPGTGVAAALAVNVGSAGAPVVNGGALGTPSSGTLTNCSGLPAAGYVAMIGDSGAGGTQGAVPAPAAGDAAAGKYLKADGTWAAAGGSASTGFEQSFLLMGG